MRTSICLFVVFHCLRHQSSQSIGHYNTDLALGVSREFTFSRVSADILLALYSPFTFSRVSADILLALYSP